MKQPDTTEFEINTYGEESKGTPVIEASNQIKHILDAKYEKLI